MFFVEFDGDILKFGYVFDIVFVVDICDVDFVFFVDDYCVCFFLLVSICIGV